MPALTSAAGLVGFLSEPDPTLQAFALERLNEEIDSVWTEVSGSIGQMYVHHESLWRHAEAGLYPHLGG
jgi:26S proteasome regulatory subunit N2